MTTCACEHAPCDHTALTTPGAQRGMGGMFADLHRERVRNTEDTDAVVWECGPHANAWNGHDARCRQVPRPTQQAATDRVVEALNEVADWHAEHIPSAGGWTPDDGELYWRRQIHATSVQHIENAITTARDGAGGERT